MKKFLYILLILLANFSFSYAQFTIPGIAEYQHNPRAEAMGRAHTGLEGDINSIIFNPLSTAYLEDLQISYCNSAPFGFNANSNISFFALGTKVNKWFKIGLAYRSQLEQYNYTSDYDELPQRESATLALGFKLSNHTFLSVASSFNYSRNYNIFSFEPYPIGYQPLYLENHVGFSGKYFLNNKRNFFTTTFKSNWKYYGIDEISWNDDEAWSVLFTLGNSFHLASNKLVFDKYRLFNLISTVELTKDLTEQSNLEINRFSYFKFSFGNELTILDYLSLRLGFVYWNVNYPYSSDRAKRYGLTYGLGFKFPLHEFINQERPINFHLDYCYLPQYFYNNLDPDFPNETHNFQDISLRMSVALKKPKKQG